MIKMDSDIRRFAFTRLKDNPKGMFSILVYEKPTSYFLYRTYHKTGDCFVCGAKVFWTLLACVRYLQKLGFERVE